MRGKLSPEELEAEYADLEKLGLREQYYLEVIDSGTPSQPGLRCPACDSRRTSCGMRQDPRADWRWACWNCGTLFDHSDLPSEPQRDVFKDFDFYFDL